MKEYEIKTGDVKYDVPATKDKYIQMKKNTKRDIEIQ